MTVSWKWFIQFPLLSVMNCEYELFVKFKIMQSQTNLFIASF